MNSFTKFHLEARIAKLKAIAIVLGLALLFFPSFTKIRHTGDNMYTIYLNGTMVGMVDSMEDAKADLQKARLQVAKQSQKLFFADVKMTAEGDEMMVGKIDSSNDVIANMCDVLVANEMKDRQLAYMIKINQFVINLDSAESVTQALQAALDKYDANGEFEVELVLDPDREINVLTTKITDSDLREQENKEFPTAGVDQVYADLVKASRTRVQTDFEDYDYGLIDLSYGDEIEVIETYLYADAISGVDEAVEVLTKDQEKNEIYEVQAGDTLSEIAINTNIPLDQIIAMNETLENENSTIRVGDELIITVPQPELSVNRQEEIYYEEDYDAPIEYIYNDDWYTTEKVTRVQPSAGHRKVAAIVNYHNASVVETQILKEQVTIKPVAKVIEVGTKTPPTYIKPISGGRLTSYFGRRKSPTKGASSYHKGIDWATPVGTAVMASSAGTVVKAGWGSGYGYVVYIQHADGRQTRYGHLSKVLVSPGQTVSQGQKIALSGNTGVSTGPHIHFEILINGSQVNPFDYMN